MSPGWIVSPGSLDPHYIELASTAWAGQKKTTFPAPSLVDWPFLAHIPGPQAGGSVLPVGRQVMWRERRDTLLQLSRSTKIHRGSRRCGADETENAQVVLMESFVVILLACGSRFGLVRNSFVN